MNSMQEACAVPLSEVFTATLISALDSLPGQSDALYVYALLVLRDSAPAGATTAKGSEQFSMEPVLGGGPPHYVITELSEPKRKASKRAQAKLARIGLSRDNAQLPNADLFQSQADASFRVLILLILARLEPERIRTKQSP